MSHNHMNRINRHTLSHATVRNLIIKYKYSYHPIRLMSVNKYTQQGNGVRQCVLDTAVAPGHPNSLCQRIYTQQALEL